MQGFKIAAKRAAGKDEEVIEIPFGERTLISRRPKTGQIALFYQRAASAPTDDEPDNGAIAAVFGLLKGILAEGDTGYLRGLITDGVIDFGTLLGGDEDNEMGLVDAILAEWAARPTTSSTDSGDSPEKTGRPSTGRTPGKGSTRSTSKPTDS